MCEVVMWIEAFLSLRRQRIVFGKCKSKRVRVAFGPTLFVLYINDLQECCDPPIKLNADNSKVLIDFEQGEEASGAQKLLRCTV
jgi:hypothetical protein